jgi:hypothetical protein
MGLAENGVVLRPSPLAVIRSIEPALAAVVGATVTAGQDRRRLFRCKVDDGGHAIQQKAFGITAIACVADPELVWKDLTHGLGIEDRDHVSLQADNRLMPSLLDTALRQGTA